MGWHPPHSIARFMEKVERPLANHPTGCWIWLGQCENRNGRRAYGRFWYEESNVMAHRFAYEVIAGKKIPEGYQIDHICRNPSCVNPDHLQAVTQLENTMRTRNPMAINARKTHCIRGHILEGKNVYISNVGTRKCLTCVKLRTQQFRKTGKYTIPI